MDQPEPTRSCPAPTDGGQFSWPKLAVWLSASLAAGVAVAWFAEIAQSYFAPLLLFPLLVGLGLGAVLIAVMRLGHVGNRPTVVLGTVLAAALAVVGQHYFIYRVEGPRLERLAERRAKKLAEEQAKQGKASIQSALTELAGEPLPPPPDSLLEFLREQAGKGRPMLGNWVAHGWQAWLSWAVDALLVLAGAGVVVVPTMRLPYCNQCRKWYRTIRSNRIDTAMAQRVSELTDLSPPEKPLSARYRLSACPGGCGPTRLELSWETRDGSTYLARTWLDAAARNRLMELMDEGQCENHNDEAENAE